MIIKTPLTDERTYSADCLGKTLVVNAEWARVLERENAELHDALKIGELPHPMWSKDDLCFQYQQALAERDEETKMRKELERENAALRHTEENLASTVRGLEFELEKANAALDLLNTHCMSADPIMGRSTYRWTIEHDEPDIRVAIAELRKAQV